MKITKQEAIERIEGVLEAAGISVDIFVPGGAFFDVEFPDGATFEDCEIRLDIACDGISHQRS